MKPARFLLGLICGSVCLAFLSGCETQRSACEREKRLTERMDELQMELDGRISGVNNEMASFRTNPPVVVQQAPAPAIPDYSMMAAYNPMPQMQMQIPPPMPMPMPEPLSAQTNIGVDTISIEDDFYSASKRQQLEALAASSLRDQVYDAPKKTAPKQATGSNAAKHIRVPVPVRTIQAALKEAGFYNGAIDGKVGQGTIRAITDFQRSVGLKADGICGRQTWQQLQGYVPAGMSTQRLK